MTGGENLESLVGRARSGDRAAQDDLYRRYQAPVRAAIRARLGRDLRRRVDTDDVYQSTIAASLADLARIEYRGEKAFVAWLTQVAERRVVDAARRHRAARRDVARERPIEAAADRSGSLTSPTQSAVRGESRADVARAVALLPERERRALELRSVEGRSFQEIADALGLADRHVARKLVQVALMEMGDLLERGRSP